MAEKINAVIVEDEIIIVMLLKNFLVNAGFNVLGHADSEERTVRLLEKSRPQVIFMDIFINGPTNGIELVKKINKENEFIIVYLTGNNDEITKKEALKTTPFDYLTKPINKKVIEDIYGKIIRGCDNGT